MTRREAKGLLSAVKDRIHEVKKFALHAGAYITINMAVLMINVLEVPDGSIVMIPMILLGIPLAVHWNRVFGRKGKKEKQWEEAMLHEFMYGEEMPEPIDELLLVPEKKRALLNLSRAKDVEINTLQKRIENLEAIITSKKWDELDEREKEMQEAARQVEALSRQVE